MNYAIVGTAGHVDHGKTLLTRQLTGVDSDRLKEEKERGISIRLGFAPFVLPNGQKVGLVDVPGHERFVRQMLAGAGGMDLVLLVIAADEGIMPQTREHIDILRLLGVERAVVVITKTDLADPEWLELVEEEIQEYLEKTPFAGAPRVRVSSVTGEGIPALQELLAREIEALPAREQAGQPRLPIDRVFTIRGFGTVVTGTLWSGTVRTGDTLVLMPQYQKVRVRSIQVHGAAQKEAVAGQRVALNLADVEVQEVGHGSVLVPDGILEPTFRLDLEFFLLEDKKELPHRARIRVHLGTREVLGRIRLLDRETLSPGETALVQLQLEEEIVASRGDRVVVRSYSPMETVGGGRVLDTNPPRHRRNRPEVLAELRIRAQGAPEELLLRCLDREKVADVRELSRRTGQSDAGVQQQLEALAARRQVALLGDQAVREDFRQDRAGALRTLLEDYEARYPLRPGYSREDIRSRLFHRFSARAFQAFLEGMLEEGAIRQSGSYLRTRSFEPVPTPEEEEAIGRMEAAFRDGGLMPPDPREIIDAFGEPGEEYFFYLLGQGRLVRLEEPVVFAREVLDRARDRIVEYLEERGEFRLSDARDLLGSTRKYVLPLLEYLDREKVTRRVEDKRVLVRKRGA